MLPQKPKPTLEPKASPVLLAPALSVVEKPQAVPSPPPAAVEPEIATVEVESVKQVVENDTWITIAKPKHLLTWALVGLNVLVFLWGISWMFEVKRMSRIQQELLLAFVHTLNAKH